MDTFCIGTSKNEISIFHIPKENIEPLNENELRALDSLAIFLRNDYRN
jgi:hypothetical protein